MHSLDKYCSLLFDEISFSDQLTFDSAKDKVLGYVDLGLLGRINNHANHAIVFMIHGLHKPWKQPVAYFFTKDTVKTPQLKFLIKNVIMTLEEGGYM